MLHDGTSPFGMRVICLLLDLVARALVSRR
jgi:hypothetical protein